MTSRKKGWQPDERHILSLIRRQGTLSITSKRLDSASIQLRKMRDEGIIASCNGYWYLTPRGEREAAE